MLLFTFFYDIRPRNKNISNLDQMVFKVIALKNLVVLRGIQIEMS